jgi:enterochelin esterase-like enzyme
VSIVGAEASDGGTRSSSWRSGRLTGACVAVGEGGVCLIPYVGKNYRVTDRRTLIGQSRAGLLATQTLLEQPRLFTA